MKIVNSLFGAFLMAVMFIGCGFDQATNCGRGTVKVHTPEGSQCLPEGDFQNSTADNGSVVVSDTGGNDEEEIGLTCGRGAHLEGNDCVADGIEPTEVPQSDPIAVKEEVCTIHRLSNGEGYQPWQGCVGFPNDAQLPPNSYNLVHKYWTGKIPDSGKPFELLTFYAMEFDRPSIDVEITVWIATESIGDDATLEMLQRYTHLNFSAYGGGYDITAEHGSWIPYQDIHPNPDGSFSTKVTLGGIGWGERASYQKLEVWIDIDPELVCDLGLTAINPTIDFRVTDSESGNELQPAPSPGCDDVSPSIDMRWDIVP